MKILSCSYESWLGLRLASRFTKEHQRQGFSNRVAWIIHRALARRTFVGRRELLRFLGVSNSSTSITLSIATLFGRNHARLLSRVRSRSINTKLVCREQKPNDWVWDELAAASKGNAQKCERRNKKKKKKATSTKSGSFGQVTFLQSLDFYSAKSSG